MTHVVEIDIITGHELKVIYILFCRIFSLLIYRKNMQFLKTCTVNYESITYCLFLKPWIKEGENL